MSPVVPRLRRPDQNTGRRAMPVREVESVACDLRGWGAFSNDPGNHQLYNDKAGVTRCRYCTISWAELDAALREAS